MKQQNLLHGATLILASELMFASMGALVKALSSEMPSEMLVFMRNIIGMLFVLPLALRGGLGRLRTAVFRLHLLRGIAGVAAMYCFFFVLGQLKLADALLLKMTAPIFVPLVALAWLREWPAPWALAAVPVGLLGVTLILQPAGSTHWVVWIGLLGGALAAVAKVTVRRLSRTEPTVRIVCYFALIATAISAAPLIWAWRTPGPLWWGGLVLVGLLGTAGQLLLTRGYSVAPAAHVGPFTYFSVVFGAAFGYLFWDEVLNHLFIAGAALVALAGILAVFPNGRAIGRPVSAREPT